MLVKEDTKGEEVVSLPVGNIEDTEDIEIDRDKKK